LKTDAQLTSFHETLYDKLEIFRESLIQNNIEPKMDVSMKILSRFLFYVQVNTEFSSTEELLGENAITKFIQSPKYNDLKELDEKTIKQKIEAFLSSYFE
jgi:hypothetical protein